VEALEQNAKALIDALMKAKPAAAKGSYLRKVAVSSTMGVGIKVDPASAVQA
jgi:large subunit ribosomal protein L1